MPLISTSCSELPLGDNMYTFYFLFMKPKGTSGQKFFCAVCQLLEWLGCLSGHYRSIQWMLVKLGCSVQGSSWNFTSFETNCTYSESSKTLIMLRYAMYVTVNIIFIHFDMHSYDISYIVPLVWPTKGLRNRLVARGRKRLCTTGINEELTWLRHINNNNNNNNDNL